MNPFYYKRGKFETVITWRRPTYDSVKSFLIDLQKNTDIFKRYKLKIIGKVLVDITNTWDVDITLSNIDGTHDIPVELENDMNIIYRYGINRNRVLPDLCWVDHELHNLSKEDYVSGNYQQITVNRIKTTNIIKIVNGETVINQSEPINEGIVFLSKDLVMYEHSIWPWPDTPNFKMNPTHTLEDYFILENQVHFYNALDFIKSTQESFLTETNPLYGKTSKIM
jgi:hypothetical protein